MSAHAVPALEPSSSTTFMAGTVQRRSVQAYEATAVVPAMLAMDECTVRWQGKAQARQGLPRKPVGAGVHVSSILSHYHHSFAGVDRHDALAVLRQQVLPEDVLR
jgi:hypothetical protein